MSKTFGDQVISFNEHLHYKGKLPKDFEVLNPFKDNPETVEVMKKFYRKYYDDHRNRRFLIGINPGRHGAGVTGVPFTDTKRLERESGIAMKTVRTHEVSSVYVYDMIDAYGGPDKFFHDFYINSPFPLAIVRRSKGGREVNANYYDDKELFEDVRPWMTEMLKKQIAFGLDTDVVYIMGKKNAEYIKKINDTAHLFKKMVVLEHPRYIQQYKSKEKDFYIDKYLNAFASNGKSES